MTQCHFTRQEGDRVVHPYGWIPSSKAIIGRTVRFKDMDGVWKVRACFSQDDSDNILGNSNDYKRHRKATDI